MMKKMKIKIRIKVGSVTIAIVLNLKELVIAICVKDVRWAALCILIHLLALGLKPEKYSSYSHYIGD